MNEDLIGILASIAAIIIVLTLSYFYKTRFKHQMLQGRQRLIGVIVIVISLLIALLLIN